MPMTVYWEDAAKTVQRWDLSGHWTPQELYEANTQSHEMIAEIDHEFIILVDAREATPPKQPLVHLRRVFENASPQLNMTIIVSSNVFVSQILNVLSRARIPHTERERLLFTASMDRARDAIAQRLQQTPVEG